MKKTAKFCLKCLRWLAFLLVIVVGFISVRILFAPLEIPYASAFGTGVRDDGTIGWSANVEKGTVGWDWRHVRPWVRVEHLKTSNPEGTVTIDLEEAWVALSPTVLFGGDVSIEGITASNGMVLIRQGGGPSFFENLDFSQGLKAIGPVVNELLTLDKKISDLELSNIKIEFQNSEGKKVFEGVIPEVSRHQRRNISTIAINTNFTKDEKRLTARLGLRADHNNNAASISFSVDPFILGEFVEGFEQTKAITVIESFKLPISLSIDMTASVDSGMESGEFFITGGRGTLHQEIVFVDPAEVGFINIEGMYDPARETIMVHDISADLGGRPLKGDALVYFEEGIARPGIRLDFRIPEIKVADLPTYWPTINTGKGRNFVKANMSAGTVKDIHFQMDMRPDGPGPWERGSSVRTDFTFDGLDARYSRTLPIIVDARGKGWVTKEVLRMSIDKGSTFDIQMKNVEIVQFDINKPGQSYGTVDAVMKGKADKFVGLAGHKPINLGKGTGLKAERFGGDLNLKLHLETPFRKGVTADEMEYTVDITSKNATVAEVLKDGELTDGNVTMTLNKRELLASGDAKINGVPMDFTWTEDFLKGKIEGENTTILRMSGFADGADLAALNIPFEAYLPNKIPVGASFNGRKFILTEGSFSADATDAILILPQLGWEKEAGRAVEIELAATFKPTETLVETFRLSGPDIDLNGSFTIGRYDREGYMSGQLQINQLDDNKDIHVDVHRYPDVGYITDVTAKTIDARGLLNFDEQDERQEKLVLKEDEPLSLTLLTNEMIMVNGEVMNTVSFNTNFSQGEPFNSELTGKYDDGSTMIMQIDNSVQKPRAIHIETTNGGKMFRSLGLFVQGEGGTLTFDGMTDGWSHGLTLEGKAEGTKIMLLPTSMLGPEVIEGKLEGLNRFAGEDGLMFEKLSIPFKFKSGLLDVSGMRANSVGLGLTLEGELDRNARKVNMNGVFVPAYGINSMLSSIPLIGSIFTGGKGKGIFAIKYRVKGMIDNPTVTVNEASGLAPGFLRSFFGGGKGKVSSVEDEAVAEPTDPDAPQEKSPEDSSPPED